MSDITRKKVIENLETLKAFLDVNGVFTISDAMKKSIDFAIASLETDEAYQLEYESTTKDNLGVDAISRKALLDATVKKNSVWNKITNSEGDNLETIIAKLPSVTSHLRWIPVSERVPEDSGEYLVSVIDEYNEDQSYYKAVEVAWFAHKKDYDIKESEWRELGIDETVIAWMPLPKAYSEVEE